MDRRAEYSDPQIIRFRYAEALDRCDPSLRLKFPVKHRIPHGKVLRMLLTEELDDQISKDWLESRVGFTSDNIAMYAFVYEIEPGSLNCNVS